MGYNEEGEPDNWDAYLKCVRHDTRNTHNHLGVLRTMYIVRQRDILSRETAYQDEHSESKYAGKQSGL